MSQAKLQIADAKQKDALWRIQVEACLREAIRQWNETAQVLHQGHIFDLSRMLATAIVHPNSIVRR